MDLSHISASDFNMLQKLSLPLFRPQCSLSNVFVLSDFAFYCQTLLD